MTTENPSLVLFSKTGSSKEKDLLALILSGSYLGKPHTKFPCCTKPQQATINLFPFSLIIFKHKK